MKIEGYAISREAKPERLGGAGDSIEKLLAFTEGTSRAEGARD